MCSEKLCWIRFATKGGGGGVGDLAHTQGTKICKKEGDQRKTVTKEKRGFQGRIWGFRGGEVFHRRTETFQE
jgi:hypothetical protein